MTERFIMRLSVGQHPVVEADGFNAGAEAKGYVVEVEDGEPNNAHDEIAALLALAHYCDRRISTLLGEPRLVDE